ncbi:hypothetical protein [Methylobacterium sp. R2-1]|uniref:hypothetical protein n=1 Tax=Methylobacterium sp. R2-1 TaxID=2587064 RepID=UPI00160B0BB7|nr:hypothetical protein [Methylobacterium sp. R2-1]MBB2963347.1 hypothetical protein [Methylobacterium sp. R2-1]
MNARDLAIFRAGICHAADIDSLAGGGCTSQDIWAVLGRKAYGMNSRTWIWRFDQTTLQALASPILPTLSIKFAGSLEVKSTHTIDRDSACSHTKHSFQSELPGRMRLPILEALKSVILLHSLGIARLLPELKLSIRTSGQSHNSTCGFDDAAAFCGTVNGASA